MKRKMLTVYLGNNKWQGLNVYCVYTIHMYIYLVIVSYSLDIKNGKTK